MKRKIIEKAGFMPYILQDGEPVFCFMTPSDYHYGGPQPGIAKGHIEDGETELIAAVREAQEELGLKLSNIISKSVQRAWSGMVPGKKESYQLTVFIGEVISKKNFKKPDHETESIHWMTSKEFTKEGRKSQVHIVNSAKKLISKP